MLGKKLWFIGIATAYLFALCAGLVACGTDTSANFTGSWRVTSMKDSSGTDLTANLEQLNSANKILTISLNEDKTASFDMAGQQNLAGTWKPLGENNCSISFEGYLEVEASLSDGKLVFEEDGQTMTCEKQG